MSSFRNQHFKHKRTTTEGNKPSAFEDGTAAVSGNEGEGSFQSLPGPPLRVEPEGEDAAAGREVARQEKTTDSDEHVLEFVEEVVENKGTPPSGDIPPDISSFQSSVKINEVLEGPINNPPQETWRGDFPGGYDEDRALLPSLQKETTKFNLGDPLAKTVLGHLELLEGLSRSLDKEYKNGVCKCWKHIAEHFDIERDDYQNFRCNQVHSPTEAMFDYLESSRPETTIGKVKEGLQSIGIQDVVDVLIEYQNSNQTLNDETLMSSLFDSYPDVTGKMAFLLDRQKVGLKNWYHLAVKLKIPRNTIKTFGTSNSENPTKRLFEILKVHKRNFTQMPIVELISRLENMERRDVINVIHKSTKVTDGSLIKDLMGDVNIMDDVHNLLNQKQRTNKIQGWKHLGESFGIEQGILDDLSPKEDLEGPTEVLFLHLQAKKPTLKIEDFIRALHSIERDDVFTLLNAYLPDGCTDNLLASCHCERCQKSTPLGTT